MPELPDVELYLDALDRHIGGSELQAVRCRSPFLLRTVQPPLSEAQGRRVTGFRRIGKRIAIGLDGDLWLVLHLMIAGRLHWKDPEAKLAGKRDLAAFDFADGSLVLTEAGSKKRA
jgi:formamidopyrimidine-DNA glycosylase